MKKISSCVIFFLPCFSVSLSTVFVFFKLFWIKLDYSLPLQIESLAFFQTIGLKVRTEDREEIWMSAELAREKT